MKVFSRVAGGCLVLSLALFIPLPVLSQEPIKIGFAYVFSERLAHYGFGAKQGAELAMDEINSKGGIKGRKLVGVFADTKLVPEVAVEQVKRLIKEDRVDVVMGLVSSSEASSCAPVANELRTPLIITLAMTPDVTGSLCNPYVFRINMNGPQNIKAGALLAKQMNVKRWTTMAPDYLFGYQSWEYFQRYLSAMRPDMVFAPKEDTAFVKVDVSDLRPSIEKIVKSGADGVFVSLYGGNLVDFVRQAAALGFFDGKRTVFMNLAYSADVMLGLGLEMPQGVWLGGLYWFQGNPSQVNQDFVQAYSSRFRVWPDLNAHGAYCGVKAYAAAVEKAGSAEKDQVIKALEGLTLELPIGMATIRPEDHQAVVDGVWGRADAYDPKMRCRSLKPMELFKGADITPAVEETGCKIRR